MSLAKKDNWWVETRTFKKTRKEEYLDIDDSLVELENSSSIIRLEMNTIELPLFSKDTKRVKNQIKVYHFKTDKSSYLEIEAPANYSIPGEFEERVFIALTKIMKNKDYSRRFVVSANEILENLGLSNKSYYQRIRDALTLLSKTNYTFANSLYSNKESGIIDKKIMSSIMNIKIISKKDKGSEEIEAFEDGRIKEIYEINFSDYFYDNIIRKGYLAFDASKLLSIENAVARAIYTIVEKWRGYNLFLKRPIFFIARRIPLSWEKKNIARTIKIIDKALINLKEEGLIKDFLIVKDKKWELAEVELYFTEEHNKIKRETFFTDKNEFDTIDMVVTSTEEKIKCVTEEPTKELDGGEISEILKLFPEKVLAMKTFESFIKSSLEKHSFDYVKGTAEYTIIKKPKSYKSYLTKALEENWADEYIASKKIKENKKNLKPVEIPVTIEEAKIVQKYSYDDFEKLSDEQQSNISKKAYESLLNESQANDSKIMKNIFETSKKGLIIKCMNENEAILEKEKPIPNKSDEIISEFTSITEFIVEVSKLTEEKNIEFNLKHVVPVFKLFGEYEDKNIKIKYDEGTKQGIINTK